MKSVLVGLVLILTAMPAFADEHPASESGGSRAGRIETAVLRGLYTTTLAVQTFDARMTLNAVQVGAQEVDPLMRPFAPHPSMLVFVSLARAAAIDLGVHSFEAHHKIVGIAIGAAVNSAYLVIAEHNRDVASLMRGTPPR